MTTDADWPGGEPPVEVRRSARRTRTVSAYRQDGRVVVLLPARLSAQQEREWVRRMLDRLGAQEGRRTRRCSDAALAARAEQLSTRYLQGRARPRSVSWSAQQERRWGSCSIDTGEIRLSDRLQTVPGWVRDYVLLHELAHLLVAGHDQRFWALVGRYPRTERARGFLEGLAYATPSPAAP